MITAQFVLTRTVLGRYLVVIGINEQVARMSGHDPRPYRPMVLAVSGALAGIAGIFNTV
jgi:ribose transport system permease protein